MTRRPKQPRRGDAAAPSVPDAGPVPQVKVCLPGISPMVWRCVPLAATLTCREWPGVIQVAMGWEGIHLRQFRRRGFRRSPPGIPAQASRGEWCGMVRRRVYSARLLAASSGLAVLAARGLRRDSPFSPMWCALSSLLLRRGGMFPTLHGLFPS
jgi:hypothetical protein